MAVYTNSEGKKLFFVNNYKYNVIITKKPASVSVVKWMFKNNDINNIVNENGQYEAIVASSFDDVIAFFEKDGYILLPQKDGRSGSRTLVKQGEVHKHFNPELMPYSVAIKSDGTATIISGKLDMRLKNVRNILAAHDAVKIIYYNPPFKEKQRWGHLAVVESFRLEENKILLSYDILTESDKVYFY